MTWFKVDDSFHSHPKVLAAEPAALGLWVVAGTWSSANLTDGFVPDHALSRLLPDSVKLAESLVTCGLWRRAKGGYRFHDWGDYNPRSVDVKRERDAARERMRNLRAKRKGTGQSAKRSGEQKANVRDVFVTPTRPDPTRSSSDEEQVTPPPPAGPPTGRGELLPEDFRPTDSMRRWAVATFGDAIDVEYETAQFRSHYRSTGARRKSWPDAWQKWVRESAERRTRPRGGTVVPINSAARGLTGTDATVAGWLALGDSLNDQDPQ